MKNGYIVEIQTNSRKGREIVLNTILPQLPVQFEIPDGKIILKEKGSIQQTMKLLEALLFENAIREVEFSVERYEDKKTDSTPKIEEPKDMTPKKGSKSETTKEQKENKTEVIKKFFEEKERKPWSIKEISEELMIPYSAVSSTIHRLFDKEILVKVGKKYMASIPKSSKVEDEQEKETDETAGGSKVEDEQEKETDETAGGSKVEDEQEKEIGETAGGSKVEDEQEKEIDETAGGSKVEDEQEKEIGETAGGSKVEEEQEKETGETTESSHVEDRKNNTDERPETKIWKIAILPDGSVEKIIAMFNCEKYQDILKAMFENKKSSFSVSNMQKKFDLNQRELTDIIKAFADEAIFYDEKIGGRYKISDKWRLYVYLKEKGPDEKGNMRYQLGLTSGEIDAIINKAVADGMIQKVKVKGKTEKYSVKED